MRPLATIDWSAVHAALDARGVAVIPRLLDAGDCGTLVDLWDVPERFRARVDMARYRFGVGEYRYFKRPLPATVARLRRDLYPRLAAIANRWAEALGERERWPARLDGLLARCAIAGQTDPTPLLLRYGPGDYNRLHQDRYGTLLFPLQVTVLLSRPGTGFTGGEFVVVEHPPRGQARVEIVPLARGDAVVFASAARPIRGPRGWSRATVRHGVSRVRSGERLALGVIFHDAA